VGDQDVKHILCVLARDNECELVLQILQEHPRNGMHVARAGADYLDPDARWQLGEFLSMSAAGLSWHALSGILSLLSILPRRG
jgi:hypothetical protein